MDGRIYARPWQGGVLSGGFEKNPKPIFTEGRNQLEVQNMQEDWDHFGKNKMLQKYVVTMWNEGQYKKNVINIFSLWGLILHFGTKNCTNINLQKSRVYFGTFSRLVLLYSTCVRALNKQPHLSFWPWPFGSNLRWLLRFDAIIKNSSISPTNLELCWNRRVWTYVKTYTKDV